MRTTIDLPEQLLEDVQSLSGSATRRDAVVIALEDYVRRVRRQRLIAAAGTLDLDLDVRELRGRDRKRRD